MSLSREDVLNVAKLSALAVSEQEISMLQTDLGAIINYVENLSSVDTSNIEPTSHVHGVVNAFREDIVKDSLEVEKVLKNAPEYAGSSFKVPKII